MRLSPSWILSLVFLSSFPASAEPVCLGTLITKSPKITWTGYKFSDKKPVQGEFKKFEVFVPKGKFPTNQLLTNLSFAIDSLSVSSGDAARDENLKTAFFKNMKSPIIKGYIESADETSAVVMLNMNGVSKAVTFKLKKEGKKYQADGEINILDFTMAKSLEELHKVCKDLHKGPDGVAKTWSSVGLTITAEITEACK